MEDDPVWRHFTRFVHMVWRLLTSGGYSSVVEHPAAIRQVLGSTPSVPFSFAPIHYLTHHNKKHGPNGDLNPGPPAPKAGIIPLDHLATLR